MAAVTSFTSKVSGNTGSIRTSRLFENDERRPARAAGAQRQQAGVVALHVEIVHAGIRERRRIDEDQVELAAVVTQPLHRIGLHQVVRSTHRIRSA